MYDLHCHILPDIDDGAKDMKESIAMLQLARSSGSDGLVATPHVIEGKWLPSWEKIVARCAEVNEAARKNDIEITVYPGAEVGLNWDILENINGPGPYCINGGNHMLVELPALEIPRYTEEFFFALQTKGITPVVAHPERQAELIRHPEIIGDWLQKGILMQINGPSLTGRFGQKVRGMAELLLIHNMVHCIGSDAHGVRSRKPELFDARKRIRALTGEEAMRHLLLDNPQLILHSKEIPVAEIPVEIKTNRPRGILGRLTNFVRTRLMVD